MTNNTNTNSEQSITTGEKIRSFRLDKGMTQKELGEKSGLGSFFIHKYETGLRVPKLEKLMAIAKGLDVDFRLLLDNETLSFFSADDVDRANLLRELRELRIENEILKERLLQIEALAILD